MTEHLHPSYDNDSAIEIYTSGYLDKYPWQEKLVQPCKEAGIQIAILSYTEAIELEFKNLCYQIAFKSSIYIRFKSIFFESNELYDYKNFSFIEFIEHGLDLIITSWGNLENIEGLAEYSPTNILMTFIISDKVVLTCCFSLAWEKPKQKKAWGTLSSIIRKIKASDDRTVKWINSLHVQKDRIRYLFYDLVKEKWELFDRLMPKTDRIAKEFMDNVNDPRLHKPKMIFNEDNYDHRLLLEEQWQLQLENLPLIMDKPNDIALYIQLADKNIQKAKVFFDSEYNDLSERFYLPLIRKEKMLEYYDYFEHIIAAITFSYTSLETFVNICIPKDFTIEREEGIIYSKKGIERRFSLKEKFMSILPEILKSPDPSNKQKLQPWWDRFLKLESVRNEIIHTKQSKSQERYSLFLSKEIFELLAVNKEIIRFYGFFINQNKKDLLIYYPFGYGFDGVLPAFISNKNYFSYQRNRRGLK